MKIPFRTAAFAVSVIALGFAGVSDAQLDLPGQSAVDDLTAKGRAGRAIEPVEPAAPAQPAEPNRARVDTSYDPTLGLQDEINEINERDLNRDDLRELKDDIGIEIDDLEADLEEEEAELELLEDELRDLSDRNRVRNSDELEAAEAKLDELNAELRALDGRLGNVGRRARDAIRERDGGRIDNGPLLDEVRALGADIASFRADVDELDILVDKVEDVAD